MDEDPSDDPGDDSQFRLETPLAESGGGAGSTTPLDAPALAGNLALCQAELDRARERVASLLETQRDLRRAESLAQLGSWRFDLSSGTVIASEGARRIYGLGDESWSIERVQTIPLEEHRAELDLALERLIDDGTPYDLEFRIRRPSDGAIRHIHSVGEYDATRRVVIGAIHDVTEHHLADQEVRRNVTRLQAVVEILQHRSESLQQFLDHALDRAISLTGSTIGYIYLYHEDRRELVLTSWSKEVMQQCAVVDPQICYELEKIGAWGEAVRQRRPIVLNDFHAEHPLKKGYPEGHVRLSRFLTVPVVHHERIVAVVGVANKPSDYVETDVLELTLLMDAVWKSVETLQSEQALRASEERFRSYVENAPFGVFIADRTGRYLEVNPEACRITGHGEAELLTMSIPDLLPPHSRESAQQHFQRVVETGSSTGEVDFVHSSGEVRRWRVSATRIDPDRFLGFVEDVTEARRTAERLIHSRDLMRYVIEHANAAVAVHDRELRYLYVSQRYLQEYGVTDADVIGRHHYDVFPDLPQKWREVHQRALAGEVSGADRDPYPREDGTVEWTRWQCRPWHEADGSIGGLIVYTEVITDRVLAEEALRESEARYRSLVEHAQAGIWSIDADGVTTFVNPRMAAMLGYSCDDMVGRHLFSYMDDNGRVLAESNMNRRRQGIAEAHDFEFLHADGSRVLTSVNTSPLLDSRGEFAGATAVVTDVTEARRAEEQRRKLEQQLQQAQKMESIGRLAGGVAHDFNNMLGVILARTEMMLMDLEPEDPQHDELEEIRKAAMRSADLTRQLLAFARRQTIAPKALDLNDTVEGMLKMLRRLIGEDLDLVWKPHSDLWSVKMDPAQLDQVLANLCVNARDAIAGAGRLTIETGNVELDEAYCAENEGFKPGRYVMLAVSDDGCGMDAETRSHLFEPFFTTKDLGEGTGLGLATLFGIITQNKGFIHVYSEPGEGSTFKIYLPWHQGTLTMSVPPSRLELPTARGETVLLVEDDPAILKVTARMLERLGYAVVTSSDPTQAVELARTHPGRLDLVVTDVVMPGMSGKQLAEQIAAARPGIGILFMSGYTANVIAHRGILDEEVHFIQKPFTLVELATRLREALGRDD